MIDVQKAAKSIGIPVEKWPGQCYGIACAFIDHGVVEGKAIYGHWTGPVNPRCEMFYGRFRKVGFVHHGWVLRADDSIVDPTRWVFEAVEPYIFEGQKSGYDEGGNSFKNLFSRPRPKYSEGRPTNFKIENAEVRQHLEILVGSSKFTKEQIFWLSNLSYDVHGPLVWQVYKTLKKNGHETFIPIDNYRRAKREYGGGAQP